MTDGAAEDGTVSRAAAATALLRAEILSLALAPGQAIPVPGTCARLGVSRTTLATALRRLADEGLVRIAPQSGTRVARFSRAAMEESAFLREAVETAAVRRLAAAPPPGLVDALREDLAAQRGLLAAGALADLHAADERFHQRLVRATGFPGAEEAARRASMAVRRARLILMPDPGRAAATVAEHAAIVDALAAGEPDAAAAAMRAHLAQMLARLGAITRQRPELFEEDPHARR